MLLFIQTLPRILCAGAISRVSFYRICLDRLLGLCNHFSGEFTGPPNTLCREALDTRVICDRNE